MYHVTGFGGERIKDLDQFITRCGVLRNGTNTFIKIKKRQGDISFSIDSLICNLGASEIISMHNNCMCLSLNDEHIKKDISHQMMKEILVCACISINIDTLDVELCILNWNGNFNVVVKKECNYGVPF